MSQLPWYKEGLRFDCTQCGKCCTGQPGYVWVEEAEMEKMADYLGITLSNFKKLYIKRRDNRYLLVEKPSKNHDCVFYKDKKCEIYPARPKQCQTYPFWRENLLTSKSWEEVAKECEGINQSAPLIKFEEIQKKLPPLASNEYFVSDESE